MKSKIYTSLACFIIFIACLMTSSFAITIPENTDDYREGALIYGSTRFDTNVIITASKAYDAGVNEARLNVALNKDLADVKPVTPYFYDGASWYEITENENQPAKPLTVEQVKSVEENLNIFFVNNIEKVIEVPFNGTVDEGSVSKNVKYENGKFSVPATTFNFTFQSNGANVKVSTNVDKNLTINDEEEPQEAVIKIDPKVTFELPETIVLGEPTEFTVSTMANDFAGVMVVGTGSVNPDHVSKLEYAVGDQWVEMTGESIFGNEGAGFPLQDATSRFRVTFDTVGEYDVTFAIKNLETGKIMADVAAKTNVTTTKNVNNLEELKSALLNKNITNINVLSDITVTEQLTVNHDVAIDGNEFKISAEDVSIFHITGDKEDERPAAILTLDNINLISKNNPTIRVGTKHAVTDKETELKVIVKEGVYIESNLVGILVMEKNATVDFYGEIKVNGATAGIQGNGTNSGGYYNGGTIVNVYGGKITAEGGNGLYIPQDGTVSIKGGEIKGLTAISMKSGSLEVSGGKLEATGEYLTPIRNNNGGNATGDTIFVELNDAYVGGKNNDNIQVNIIGGELISKYGNAIRVTNTSGTDKTYIVRGENLVNAVLDNSVVYDFNKITANVNNLVELESALNDEDVETINILSDIKTDHSIVIDREITINGNNKEISFEETPTEWVNNGDNYVLKIYNTKATVNGIKLTNSNAAMLVASSDVTLIGTIDVSGNVFGGIEVSKGSELETMPKLDTTQAELVNTDEANLKPTIWEDGVTDCVTTELNSTTIDEEPNKVYYFNEVPTV